MAENNSTEILERLVRIETKVDTFKEDVNQVQDVANQNKSEIITLKNKVDVLQRDVTELREKNLWLNRSCIGTIITSVGALVLCLIKIAMGI